MVESAKTTGFTRLSLTKLWRSARSHPILVGGGLLLTAYGSLDDFRSLVGVMIDHISEIASAPDHLWLRWIFIVAGLGLIALGAWRHGAAHDRNSVADDEARREFSALISSQTQLPMIAAESWFLKKRLAEFERAQLQVRYAVEAYLNAATRMKDAGTIHGEYRFDEQSLVAAKDKAIEEIEASVALERPNEYWEMPAFGPSPSFKGPEFVGDVDPKTQTAIRHYNYACRLLQECGRIGNAVTAMAKRLAQNEVAMMREWERQNGA